ncbi:type IV pilus assembly protein PilM [Rhodococcus sp. X156]|uniref:type IV pilus assembly protein PilM n=1 Tax=Rhodococcus sp. X156 TaxID=2499145 RepID=UPI0013E368D2|nr:type IV pilus assembly protein PilM [Rhodococcus sp. X156]
MKTRRRPGETAVPAVNGDGRIIGLDIGATGVRAAVLNAVRGPGLPSVQIQALGHISLPLAAVVDGAVRDQAVVTNAVKHLAQENGFTGANVIVGTTNPQVVVRDLQMPNLPREQVRLALPFQARELVALPLDEVILDYTPFGLVDGAPDMLHGLLIAAPRLPVVAAVSAVERAGLRVATVDLSSIATLRFLAQERMTAEAVIDIGAHLTSIVVHSHGMPKVVRTVARGGQELTERLADRADLSFDDAERAKYSEGLTSGTEIATILTEGVRPLLAEIRSSLHFFAATNSDVDLERISLTGGGAWLPGLADLIAAQHAMPVEVIAPAHHIETRWSTFMRQMGSGVSASAVSVGLAMGAAA